MPLPIVVIGAGPVGLAAALCLARKGHRVTVLERRQALSTEGGDVSVAPNGVVALRSLGLEEILKPHFTSKPHFAAYAADDNRLIYEIPIDVVGEVPAWQFSRAGIIAALYDAAVKAGVQFYFGWKVITVDESKCFDSGPYSGPWFTAEITRESGETFLGPKLTTQLIIAADGVDSNTRNLLFPNTDPVPLDEVCFQWYVPYSTMAEDPATLELYEKYKSYTGLLCGNNNFITYLTNDVTKQFFVVASQQSYEKELTREKWTRPGDVQEMQKYFVDHYPEPMKTVLKKTTSCTHWRVCDSVTGAEWTSPSGKILLLGDAIHAMPPNAGQGLSTGLEDVAALSVFAEELHSYDHVAPLMRELGKVRKFRVDRLISAARNNGVLFSMPPGPERDARNAAWAYFSKFVHELDETALEHSPPNPNASYHDLGFLRWILSYNAADAARQHLVSTGLLEKL